MRTAYSRPDDPRRRISRIARLAADLVGADERALGDSFFSGTALLRMDPAIENQPDARLTLLTLCNQILRFCPHLLVQADDPDLVSQCVEIALSIHGVSHHLQKIGTDDHAETDVSVVVGNVDPGDGSIVVNSSGWVARIASNTEERRPLPGAAAARPNPIGAIAAGCLGSGEVFLRLIGYPTVQRGHELCTRLGDTGPLGTFETGPDLPDTDVTIDALLIGCGGVANGWAAALRHLPIAGDLTAVDRQPVESENIGPYALARASDIGEWKVDIIARAVEPAVTLRPFHEELDLFVPRINRFNTVNLPSLVVCGLDEAIHRHTVQRLWPAMLIDLAAGGTTAQVHVHRAGREGQCLMGAHTVPPDAATYAERVSADTGIRPQRILDDYNQPITNDDVAAAPEHHRASLETGRRAGQLICSRITQANLEASSDDDGFAPAAPFIAGLTGVMGASVTLQALTGQPPVSGWHWQYSFISGRSRGLTMACADGCECNRLETPGGDSHRGPT